MNPHRSSKVRLHAAAALALVALSSCGGGRADDPFEPGPPPAPTWALNSVTVGNSANTRLSGNNAVSGGRDDLGTMHLLWEDGSVIRHGFVSLSQTLWTVITVPNFAPLATVRRPVLAYPFGAVFLAAWLEQLGGSNRIVVSRSLDHGATWDAPISLVSTTASISSPVMHAFRRANGSLGAVVAWTDASPPIGGRIFSTTWRGGTWALSDWTSIAPISSNTASGVARDVSIAGNSEHVIAVWADTRGATGGGTAVFASRSTNGGLTWDADGLIGVPIGTSAVGSEPAVAVGPAGDVVASWTAAGAIRASRSTDRGGIWSAPNRLGDGFASRPAIGDNGRIAVAWTVGGGSGSNESLHTVGLSITLDNFLTVEGPSAMPGSATTTARTQGQAFLLGTALEMVWIDVSGGTRAVQHRTARLP